MELEAHWPEGQRAMREQFEARMDKVPEGFLVAAAQGGLAGSMTACVIRYDREHPETIGDWRHVTNEGCVRFRREVPGANALYLVSAIVHPAYRGRDLFKRMVLKEVEVVSRVGLVIRYGRRGHSRVSRVLSRPPAGGGSRLCFQAKGPSRGGPVH